MVKLVSYSIDSKTLEEFKKIAKEKSINSSKFIENVMKEFIKKNKINQNGLSETL
ncbi:MAG: hypothetical protein WC343_05670 [Bacilli bacterium]|jgi:metal-responsive CopG/Arc/MetJ family transcriptional regulator